MLKGLAAASGFIRRMNCACGCVCGARPKVHFVLDRSQEYGERIDTLIRDTKNPGIPDTGESRDSQHEEPAELMPDCF